MCGLGPHCALAQGKPTPEHALLLRREALELALYSFHDLEDVEHVVVFMPPPRGEKPSLALDLGRDDVAGQLARPLRATLPPPVPNPDTIATAPNTPAIQQLTFASLFKFSRPRATRTRTCSSSWTRCRPSRRSAADTAGAGRRCGTGISRGVIVDGRCPVV
ncbi:MAG TPA: hypothetical protein VG474_15215 [Solirubrobacteraceae bacterium]|nr:hypothetical protein [Solirubrobacteraceae bacterium]